MLMARSGAQTAVAGGAAHPDTSRSFEYVHSLYANTLYPPAEQQWLDAALFLYYYEL